MANQHTPTPWEVWDGHGAIFAGPAKENTRRSLRGGRGMICDADADDPQICQCGEDWEDIHEDNGGLCPTIQANAEFICRAVNSHEELLAFAKWAAEKMVLVTLQGADHESLIAGLAAIAQAEAGEKGAQP